MKNMKRSVRRHHYARLKQKWKKVNSWSWYNNRSDEEWYKIYAARLATTHTNCSCWMCGNCRKLEGITLQEKRNMLSFEEQVDGL